MGSRKGSLYTWTPPSTPSFRDKYYLVSEPLPSSGSCSGLGSEGRGLLGVQLLGVQGCVAQSSAACGHGNGAGAGTCCLCVFVEGRPLPSHGLGLTLLGRLRASRSVIWSHVQESNLLPMTSRAKVPSEAGPPSSPFLGVVGVVVV